MFEMLFWLTACKDMCRVLFVFDVHGSICVAYNVIFSNLLLLLVHVCGKDRVFFLTIFLANNNE
jgi:hypothetical protein